MSKSILYVIIICGGALAAGIIGYLVYEQQQKTAMIIAEKQQQLDQAAQIQAHQKLQLEQQQQQAAQIQAQQKLQLELQQQQAAQIQAQQKLQLEQQQQQAAQIQAQQKLQLELQQQQAQIQQQKDGIVIMGQTNSFVRGLVNGHLNFYIPPVPSFADTGVQTAVDSTANTLDGYVFHGIVFHRVYDINQTDIIVQWVKNFGTDRAGQEVFGHVIQVGLGWDTCYGKWEPFNGDSVQKILWHEMGHALGFNHSTDQGNIMYADGGGTKFATDLNERYFLANGYSQPIYFCGSGTYKFEISNDNQYVGFNVYVVPPNTNPMM